MHLALICKAYFVVVVVVVVEFFFFFFHAVLWTIINEY